MPEIRQIAEDPRKALADLEKELGVESGELLRRMDELAEQAGDWSEHVPFAVAESYFSDSASREQFQAYVEACDYCKRLIDTLHPSDPMEATDFGIKAAKLYQGQGGVPSRYRPAVAIPATAAASVLLTLLTLPLLQRVGLTPSVLREDEQREVVHALTMDPHLRAQLESGRTPAERFRAANVYFAMDQPQSAYREIGEGLRLAGIRATDAEKITTAADVPIDKAGPTIINAARRLTHLESDPSSMDAADWLNFAEVQAKLGLNEEALNSIRKYLEATNTDPKLVAEFADNTRSGIKGAIAKK